MTIHCAPLLALYLTFSCFCSPILREIFFTLRILHLGALPGVALINKQQRDLSLFERHLDTVVGKVSASHHSSVI
jgi:hypothetical protein